MVSLGGIAAFSIATAIYANQQPTQPVDPTIKTQRGVEHTSRIAEFVNRYPTSNTENTGLGITDNEQQQGSPIAWRVVDGNLYLLSNPNAVSKWE